VHVARDIAVKRDEYFTQEEKDGLTLIVGFGVRFFNRLTIPSKSSISANLDSQASLF
jgi:hypothetical protein